MVNQSIRALFLVILIIPIMALNITPAYFALSGRDNSRGQQLDPGKVPLVATVNVNDLPSPSSTAAPPRPVTKPAQPGRTDSPVRPTNAPIANTSTTTVVALSKFNGFNFGQSGWYPPDPQVAAGPHSLMEMVNVIGAVYSKSGVLNRSFDLHPFFNTTTSDFIGDPKVLFDAASGRWFASVFDEGHSSVDVAVSTTNDPATFNIYRLSANGYFVDQPIIGVSDDKIVASANIFTSGIVQFFVGAQYWVLNKSELVAGATSVDSFMSRQDAYHFSIHPVQSLSATTTEYMLSSSAQDQGVFLYTMTGVPPGLVSVSVTALQTSMPTKAPSAPQLGSTATLDTGDVRVNDAVWFQGKIWYGLNDGCTPAGDNQTRSCIRLTEVDTSSLGVVQDFDFGATGQYFFYPALRVDGGSSVDVVYGFSSPTIYPSVAVTGQTVGDPTGTLAQPLIIMNGTGPSTAPQSRYGDYFGAGLDPSDPTVVWVAGEYGSSATLWATLIASVRVGNGFIVAATPTTINLATGNSGTSTITIASVGSFTGTVTLTAAPSPSGPGTTVRPALISLAAGGEGTSTLTVTTRGSTPAGIYNVNVTGTTTGAPTHWAMVTVNLSGFSLSLNPLTIAIPAGSSGNCNITLTSVFGYAGTIGLTTTVSPVVTNGPATTLSSSSVALSSGTSASPTLTVSTLHKTPPGLYIVTVNATSGLQTHSLSFVAAITPITFSIINSATFTGALVNTTGTVSIDSPSNTMTLSGTISVSASNATSHAILFSNAYPITRLPLFQNGAGFRAIFLLSVPVGTYPLTTDIALTLAGSQTGITLYVTRNLDLNGDGVVDFQDLTIISNDAKCGSTCYDPRADINADGTINFYDVSIASFYYTAPVFTPDFTFSATPASLTMIVGSSATSKITLTSLEGFSGNVTLSSTTSGTSLTSSLSSTRVSITPGKAGSSTLSMTLSPIGQPGNYTVAVTGTAPVGVLTQSHQLTILVSVPPPDFNISAKPNSQNIVVGSSGTSTITLTSVLGFSGTVILQAKTTNPPRTNPPTLSLSPGSIILTSGGTSTSTLTISAAANTPLGTYSAIVNGTSSSLFHTATVNFTVVRPDFIVSASPTTLAVPAGSSTTSTLNVTSINTFAGTVNLTATITPVISGAPTSSLKPASVKLRSGTSATSTLTIATTSLTAAGLYFVNVTLTSGSLAHGTILLVIVTPVSYTINNSTTFTGVNVNTTGTLSIDSPSSSFTISGTMKVTATNSTTGTLLFSKTYTIALLGDRTANSAGVSFIFIMNVQVRPYNLSSDVSLTLTSTSRTAVIQVSRNIDFDNDGVVNMTEPNTIASDAKCGAPCYDPRVDLDADGVININDLALAATYYTAKSFS